MTDVSSPPQDAAPTADHDAIMALIRNSQEPFRADAKLPMKAETGQSGFVETTPVAAPISAEPSETAIAVDLSSLREEVSDAPEEDQGFKPAPEPEEIDLEAIRQNAFEEGRAAALTELEASRAESFEEGREAGKAEAEAELSDARAAFLTASSMLVRMDSDVLVQLDQAMSEAVMRLASERAGMAIKDAPKGFAARIENAAARLARGIEAIDIHLNPNDLKAIQKALEGHTTLEAARLRPDENLAHGDLRIQAGDIGMDDILADRL